MWSEQVQGEAIEGKLWPRGAALGERLWSDPSTGEEYKETFSKRNDILKREHRTSSFLNCCCFCCFLLSLL